MMIILLTGIAVVVAGVPIAAAVLVTIASRREETARSIAGHASGPLERAARRLLAFHARGISRPACRAGASARDRAADEPTEDDLALAGARGGIPALADGPVMARSWPATRTWRP